MLSHPSEIYVVCEPMRILVAEDDAPLAEFLRQRLEQEQFAVQVVSHGAEAHQLAFDHPYDLMILDLNLPGAGGLDVLRGIRSKRPDLPVVIVTSASMVEERVRGPDAGADDYVAKPSVFAELAARIRAVLRRGSRPARAILQIGDLEVDRVSHTVRRGSHSIDLSPKEFALLEFLTRHEGQPVSRTAIVEQVWKLSLDYDDERRGRVHQFSSPQDGLRIRPGPDSNDSRPWLSDRRQRPARLVETRIACPPGNRIQFPSIEIIFERGLAPSLLSYAACNPNS